MRQLIIGQRLYSALYMGEVDTVSDHSSAAHVRFAEEWEAAQRPGKWRTVRLSPESVAYLRDEALPEHMDRWRDWGREGATLTAAARKLLERLNA